MGFYMRSPVYTPNDPVKSVKQLHSWLYQLNENLKFMFSNLDSDNFTGEFSAFFSKEAAIQTQEEIKKLDEAIGRMNEKSVWEKPELSGFEPVREETAPAYMNAGECVFVTGEAKILYPLSPNVERKIFSVPDALHSRRKQVFPCFSGAHLLSVIVHEDGQVSLFNPGSEALEQNSAVAFSFSYGL